MTSSVIMKKNVELLPTSSKDMEIVGYNADKYYAKRLEKHFSLLKQSSYRERFRRRNYYTFSAKYNKDKENKYDLFLSKLLDDSIIKEFVVSQLNLVDDNTIEEKYVLSEINRIIDKINKKIDNMNNSIIDLKNKIKELK